MESLVITDATANEKGFIDGELVRYNNSMAPFRREPPFTDINRCIRDGGQVIAGILAQVYCWNILYIDVLWVREDYRHRGLATRLLLDVENKARELDCSLSHLDTFDFQAKKFYEKLDYSVFGVLEDCPQGHRRYYMSKKLV